MNVWSLLKRERLGLSIPQLDRACRATVAVLICAVTPEMPSLFVLALFFVGAQITSNMQVHVAPGIMEY